MPDERPKTQKTIEEQIKCVTRELALRKAVYGKKVEAGTMTPMAARHEYDCMLCVLGTLEERKAAPDRQAQYERLFPFIQEMASKLAKNDPASKEWVFTQIGLMQEAWDGNQPEPQPELLPAKRKLPAMTDDAE